MTQTLPQIDFHTQVEDKIHYTCRLVRKARAANCRIIVLHQDEAQAQQLDLALWNFSAADFLPHVMLTDPLAAITPVILTTTLEQALPHQELLINLSSEMPSNFQRFNRVIEIISIEEADAQAGRQRFKQYLQAGIKPSHLSTKAP
jgi:DNA polymerase III subunit chi